MLRRLVHGVSRLPWGFLRGLSWVLAGVLTYVVRYRARVVRDNLARCFPHQPEAWRKKVAHDFYKHFAMVLVESLKTLSMKKEDLIRRVLVDNPEFFKTFRDRGVSGLLLGAHMGNWEWAGIRSSHLTGMTNLAVYFHLKNPEADQVMNKTRRRLSNVGFVVSPKNLYKTLLQAPKPCWTYIIADQSPDREHHVRTLFLGQDAAFYDGPPRLARRLNLAVAYVHAQRLGFGRHKIRFELLAEDVSSLTDQEVMARFAQRLENDIRQNPEQWLWSHRRWKF